MEKKNKLFLTYFPPPLLLPKGGHLQYIFIMYPSRNIVSCVFLYKYIYTFKNLHKVIISYLPWAFPIFLFLSDFYMNSHFSISITSIN